VNSKGSPLSLIWEDVDPTIEHRVDMWEQLRGKRVFITGGTGFFGKWLLTSFVRANDTLGLNAHIVVLSRRESPFEEVTSYLASHPAVSLAIGDARDFRAPEGHFDYIIHEASETSRVINRSNPGLMVDIIVRGTEHALELAAKAGTDHFLFVSSGAVYGRQPDDLSHIPENYGGSPDLSHPESAYGEAKRVGELLSMAQYRLTGLKASVARCFSFVGPYMNLDIHYAVGNFIRDALRGGPIVISGDGTPYRSVMHAADMSLWLWTILVSGRGGEWYNVGSETSVTIADLANHVSNCFDPRIEVIIKGSPDPSRPKEQYVPCTRKVREEFGLVPLFDQKETIRRTVNWYRISQQ
jgi:nucleoside-diphosphate-sugar epimerase